MASCDVPDDDTVFGPGPGAPLSAEESAALDSIRSLIKRAEDVQAHGSALDREQLGIAVARARAALAGLREQRERGISRSAILARIGTTAGVVVANDVTVVGTADDGLLIVCGIAAVAAMIITDGPASEAELERGWMELRASLKALERVIAAAAATSTAEKCSEPARAAPSSPGQPAERSTVDVAPVPAPEPSKPDRQRRNTCEVAFPDLRQCSRLPDTYIYQSRHAALRTMKGRTGNHTLRIHNRNRATGGPCPDQGWHYNVRAGGERMGSIACCPCCVDTSSAPAEQERCRIVW